MTERQDTTRQLMFDFGDGPLPPPVSDYERHRRAAATRQALQSLAGRDIGAIPPVADPARREACRRDLKLFCKTYFPDIFYLPWASIQTETANRIQEAALHGGCFAMAMPRGSGKSTLCERAALWSTLYGYRRFVLVVGSTDQASREMFQSIKSALESSELLLEDFPEVCFPVQALEGINNRCKGQMCCGVRTNLEWTDNKLVFPVTPDTQIGGSVIASTSLTGRIRGMKHATADGEILRPDFAIIDDPQTFESAKSVTQTADRLKLINSDILGLAGPGKRLTAVLPCTVIFPNDLADQLLDRNLNPEWRGKRFRLLEGMPARMDLWQRYWEIRSHGQRNDKGTAEATRFYIDHQAEMDEGCRPTWPERFQDDEASAVQYAMDLYFTNRQMFLSEYQNSPEEMEMGDGEQITVRRIHERLNNRPKGEIPAAATRLTMFVDVQKNLLYWTIMAFDDHFTSWLVDYGAFPDQPLATFTTKDAHPTYRDLFPASGQEGALMQSLHEFLTPAVMKNYRREDGLEMAIDRCLVDSGWGESSDTIYTYIRESRLSGVILPSKGVGITAAVRPFSEYARRPGELTSQYEWRLAPVKNKRHVRLMTYDANYWKSFFRNRLFTTRGDPGAFSIDGEEVTERFRLLADHLSSEYSISESARGRSCDVWKLYPNRENHWLDCVVGCMVAASERGCQLLVPPPTAAGREPRPRNVYSQPQGARRASYTPSPRTYSVTRSYSVS